MESLSLLDDVLDGDVDVALLAEEVTVKLSLSKDDAEDDRHRSELMGIMQIWEHYTHGSHSNLRMPARKGPRFPFHSWPMRIATQCL